MRVLIIDMPFCCDYTDQIFSKEVLDKPGLSLFYYLKLNAESSGIKCITKKGFSRTEYSPSDLLMGISYEGAKSSHKFFKDNNIFHFLTYTGEGPLGAPNFYIHLNHRIKYYKYFMGFSGAVQGLNEANRDKFIRFNWPNTFRLNSGQPFRCRSLIALVASPKTEDSVNFSSRVSRLIRRPRNLFRSVILKYCSKLYCYNSILHLRYDFLRFYSYRKDFHLYGKNWENAIKYDKNFSKLKFANQPYPIENKDEILGKFKFVICLENTIFDGYVTEKIFDVFMAGSVPIYLPDKYSELPKETFIDIRDFDSIESLDEFLVNMSETRWNMIRSNINHYLNSKKFDMYRADRSSESILELALKYDPDYADF